MTKAYVAAVLLGLGGFAEAANWPQWRGPEFNGSSPETGLPEKFGRDENIRWSANMPGPSGSTPVIWDNYVFINSIDAQKKSRVALCLDRISGKVVWQHDMGPGISVDDRSNFSSPSPVTDGNLVYFYYGNGELVCFDLAGKKIWERSIQKDYGQFAYQWTYGASPLLYKDKLYIQVLQRDRPVNGRGAQNSESYILALDPKSGKELWKHVRPSEAVAESLEAYSTPVPYTHNGKTELLIVGGDCMTGHNPDTGAENWRWGTWNPQKIGHWRLVPSAVAAQGVAVVCGPKDAPITAVKLGGQGTLNESAIAWQSSGRDLTSDVPTPAFYKGHFYVLNGKKRSLLCVEPANGKVVWSGELEGRSVFEASPTVADGKIYVMDHRGSVFVVSAKPDAFKLLGSAEMGDPGRSELRSSVAVAHGNLFIRTNTKLYCVGGDKKAVTAQ